jgi:ribonuclease HI
MIEIYTDGSARGNPGPGGYGAILIYKEHRKELSQGYIYTTNNRMELLSVIVGLENLKKKADVLVYSDSKYVVDSVGKGWLFNWEKKNFKDRKNADLWKRFLEVYRKHDVKFQWVKGHSVNVENNNCDVLAVDAALDEPNRIKDEGYV